MLDHYRDARYHDGGRGECVGGVRRFDCYGLVRAVRAEQFGLATLPCYEGVTTTDARRVSRSLCEVRAGLQPCEAQPGAMALCYTGALALHCAVLVAVGGRLGALECTVDQHVRWQPLRQFCRDFSRVEFYT